MTIENSKKWFNNKPLLIAILFLFPPVGIFGMFKKQSALWKKLLYTFFALISSLLLLVFTLAIINPIDYYKSGLENFNKENYELAIKDFENVSSSNENYKEVLAKIEISKNKLKGLELKKEQEQIQVLENLKSFQNKWSDSIVSTWKGSYINKYSINENRDTIFFQLNKEATKGKWRDMAQMYESVYKKNLDSLYNSKLEIEFNTSIVILPNKEQEEKNIELNNRQKKIEMQFSSWDGSHSALKDYVKENMNDPSSFDHVKTTYADKGNYLIIQMTFRGKNAFGAKVLQTVNAKVDLDGNILSIN